MTFLENQQKSVVSGVYVLVVISISYLIMLGCTFAVILTNQASAANITALIVALLGVSTSAYVTLRVQAGAAWQLLNYSLIMTWVACAQVLVSAWVLYDIVLQALGASFFTVMRTLVSTSNQVAGVVLGGLTLVVVLLCITKYVTFENIIRDERKSKRFTSKAETANAQTNEFPTNREYMDQRNRVSDTESEDSDSWVDV